MATSLVKQGGEWFNGIINLGNTLHNLAQKMSALLSMNYGTSKDPNYTRMIERGLHNMTNHEESKCPAFWSSPVGTLIKNCVHKKAGLEPKYLDTHIDSIAFLDGCCWCFDKPGNTEKGWLKNLDGAKIVLACHAMKC